MKKMDQFLIQGVSYTREPTVLCFYQDSTSVYITTARVTGIATIVVL